MNRNELEQMLTLVDEKYIAELGDSEETTSDVTVQKPSIRRFVPWAAAAAAVCLCVTGVGLLQQGGLRTGTEVQLADNTASDSPDMGGYDLIWEEAENFACIDYVYDAGGECISGGVPVLPFAIPELDPAHDSRHYFYLDESGNPVRMSLILSGKDKSLYLTLCDEGRVYPTHFEVDFSADASRSNPVLHIYDRTSEIDKSPNYELYFVHNGVGMSMETFGYTAEEAMDVAAILLKEGYSAAKLWAMQSPEQSETAPYTIIHDDTANVDAGDYSLYFQREASLPISSDFDPQLYSTDMVNESGFDLAFDMTPFTGNDGIFYLDGTGRTVSANMKLYNDKRQWAKIMISARPGMFAHGQLEEPGSVERDGVRLYGCHPQEDYAELCFGLENVDCYILTYGLSEKEAVNLADHLIACIRGELEKPGCPFGDLSGEEILLGSPAYVPMLVKPTPETVQTLADALSSASWREMSREGQYPDGQCYSVFVYNDGSPFRLTFYSDLTVDMEQDGSVISYMIGEETAYMAVLDAVHPENAAELLVECEMENLHNEGVWIGRENGEE